MSQDTCKGLHVSHKAPVSAPVSWPASPSNSFPGTLPPSCHHPTTERTLHASWKHSQLIGTTQDGRKSPRSRTRSRRCVWWLEREPHHTPFNSLLLFITPITYLVNTFPSSIYTVDRCSKYSALISILIIQYSPEPLTLFIWSVLPQEIWDTTIRSSTTYKLKLTSCPTHPPGNFGDYVEYPSYPVENPGP